MFYLEHISQGFVLTVLIPTILIVLLIGVASLIDSKWLCYGISLVIAFFGSGMLFMGLLYYRAEKHFIFFPDKISTIGKVNNLQTNLLNQTKFGDFIFVLDFVIVFLILLSVHILNAQTDDTSEIETLLSDYQRMLVSIRQSLDKMEENLADQNKLISELKDSNAQLKETNSELMQKKSELKEKCENSRPEIQKEVVYSKNENVQLEESLEQLEAFENQLERSYQQKEQELEEAKENQALNVDEVDTTTEAIQEVIEEEHSQEYHRVQKAKDIAQQIYEEMHSRLNKDKQE